MVGKGYDVNMDGVVSEKKQYKKNYDESSYRNRDVVVTVEKVTKKYGSKTIFRDVNMQLLRGQSIVILGKDGCGKTTFLKTVAKLINIDSGSIKYNNDKMTINYLPDVFPRVNMSVKKYLHYIGGIRGLNKSDIVQSCDILYDRFNMQDLKNVHMGKLTDEERHKVGVLQALLTQPELLILDEPMLNQTKKEQLVFCDFVRRYVNNGTTVLMASTERNIINNIATGTFELGGVLKKSYTIK